MRSSGERAVLTRVAVGSDSEFVEVRERYDCVAICKRSNKPRNS
jgi:hypothetical protein